ncbi:hypothetical protein [Mucilaginibacter psychrotolerans]|uniref:Uncharacterized protein n=1 Tax=Mucilaginibacter psychrotolerans TaxID=1524096 RepID=A0A4Y8S9N2_9SPHI|nr:hypothetical protein [Mucilaginibacter psychrotolerans]TFF35144.1 hypothetical protein E2R66_19460 [Mucilaginibacter psychrotolerans]
MDALVISKEGLHEVLSKFPDTVILEGFIESIIIHAKIEKGVAELERGEGMDWEDVKKEMDKW